MTETNIITKNLTGFVLFTVTFPFLISYDAAAQERKIEVIGLPDSKQTKGDVIVGKLSPKDISFSKIVIEKFTLTKLPNSAAKL